MVCCDPSIKRETRKYIQFSITRSQILMRIPAEQSKTFSMLSEETGERRWKTFHLFPILYQVWG